MSIFGKTNQSNLRCPPAPSGSPNPADLGPLGSPAQMHVFGKTNYTNPAGFSLRPRFLQKSRRLVVHLEPMAPWNFPKPCCQDTIKHAQNQSVPSRKRGTRAADKSSLGPRSNPASPPSLRPRCAISSAPPFSEAPTVRSIPAQVAASFQRARPGSQPMHGKSESQASQGVVAQ